MRCSRTRLRGGTLEAKADTDPMLWSVVDPNQIGNSGHVPSVFATLVVLGPGREDDAKRTFGQMYLLDHPKLERLINHTRLF